MICSARPALEALAAEAPASAVTEAVRRTLDALRENILSGAVTELPCEETLCAEIAEACRSAGFLPSAASSTQPAWCFIPIWGGLL